VLRNGAGATRRAGLSRIDRFLGLDEAAGPATVLAFASSQDNAWKLGADKSDEGMVRALAAKLVADGIADRRRIYLAGVSSGGLLALRILCDGADYLAGAAVLIANAPTAVASGCKPARPIPFFFMAGTADPLMPFTGGEAKLVDFKGEVVSAEATVAPFAAAAECGKNKATQDMPDRDPTDGSRVVVEHFYDCKAPLEIWRIDGGGHALPGRPVRADRGAIIGARNNDIDASRVLIDFFRRAGR
jgi:polyhydroxybutyrate depolymerase